jgi:membrane-associated phospholipid phosphatase
MRFITDFADLAVLLPLTVCIGGGFGWQGWRRGAVAWVASVTATLAAMLTLKLVFVGCAATLGEFSPSGHTAAGTVIYGGLVALWLRRRGIPAVACLVAGAGPASCLIGASRVAVSAHSLVEVAVGATVGTAGVALLLRLAGVPPPGLRLGRVAAVALVVMLVLHGLRLPVEPDIKAVAGWLPARVCRAVGG